MKILPVLDLMDGNVVRGVGGRREEYRPIQSVLTDRAERLAVARAFRDRLGLSEFYVADLDAIRFGRPQVSILRQLAAEFPGLLVDIGVHQAEDADWLLEIPGTVAVLGLETLAGPSVIEKVIAVYGPDRLVFSLDLQAGTPMGNREAWDYRSPVEIAGDAAGMGVETLIVLDLAQVGEAGGVSTLPLCRAIQHDFPHLRLVTGGGIRNADDLTVIKQNHLDGVLIASAFHTGAIGPDDLEAGT